MVMKDYYEILGVDETAAMADIKRAYFGMVRQFPPEKEPEKFKEYRKAYEVLFDEHSRKEYDSIKSLPPDYQKAFDYARQLMADRKYEFAIDTLKRILVRYPDMLIINCMLAEAYSLNDNTGNAVKIYEKIVKLEPDNMAYQRALGDAYAERGFNKKALTQFKKTLELEPDNLDVYAAIVALHLDAGQHKKAWEYLQVGLKTAEEQGLDNTKLLVSGVIFCISDKDHQGLKQYIDRLADKMAEETVSKEAIAAALLMEIFQAPPVMESVDDYYQVLDFIAEQVPELDEVQQMRQEFRKYQRMHALEQDGHVPDVIVAYTGSIYEDCDCPSCRVERLVMELTMLDDIVNIRKSLHYLRNNYPDVFALKTDFYQDLLNVKKERRLYERLFKTYQKYKKQYPQEFLDADDDWDDEPEFSEPYVRPEQKVGRNDPCPCGSGKKYKKCCGANQ